MSLNTIELKSSITPIGALSDLDVYVLHSLLQNRVPPCFTDQQIGHLDNHNTGEEGCVAGELQDLSALICLVYKKRDEKIGMFLILSTETSVDCTVKFDHFHSPKYS